MTTAKSSTWSNNNNDSQWLDGDDDDKNEKFHHRKQQPWKEERWNIRYEECKAFIGKIQQKEQDDNNNNTPGTIQQLPKRLQHWIRNQKQEYKKMSRGQTSTMTEERLRKLQDLGSYFGKFREIDFHVRWNQLREYLQNHQGIFPHHKLQDSDPDKNNINNNMSDDDADDTLERDLWIWCRNQRVQYKRFQSGKTSTMTQERIDLLNQIGFPWDTRDLYWDEMFQHLKEFVAEHHHFSVRNHTSSCPQLVTWMDNQRRKYRAMKKQLHTMKTTTTTTTETSPPKKRRYLTLERFQLLDGIGFPWDCHEERWMQQYSVLIRYVQERGTTSLPPFGDRTYGKLRKWLRDQNCYYQKYVQGEQTSMTLERKQRLDDVLGSAWRLADTNEQSLPSQLNSEDEA